MPVTPERKSAGSARNSPAMSWVRPAKLPSGNEAVKDTSLFAATGVKRRKSAPAREAPGRRARRPMTAAAAHERIITSVGYHAPPGASTRGRPEARAMIRAHLRRYGALDRPQ